MKRFLKIFGKAFVLKLLLVVATKKLNVVKVFHARQEIIKSSVGASTISLSFLLMKWLFQRLKSFLLLSSWVKNHSKPQNLAYLSRYQSFFAGILASLATNLMNHTEIGILKVFLYMRAINGFLLLFKHAVERILNHYFNSR